MLPTSTKAPSGPALTAKKERGRRPAGSYVVNITVGVDLSRVSLEEDVALLHDRATIPPLLENYALDNGHTMPDGLYGFFGDESELALKRQIDYQLETNGGKTPPIWDVSTSLTFHWADPDNRPTAATMAWKNPRDLQGAFVRIGRISGATNDLLRFYTGDRLAVDRLTLEPWRVDDYAAVLEEVYGPIRAIIFDALMSDGNIQTVVKVYDPAVVEAGELRPLYRFLSSRDPNQPRAYEIPSANWSGWKKSAKLLTKLDIADIKTFVSQPREDSATRELLTNRRRRMLREEDRFRPRVKEIKAVAQRRKSKNHSQPSTMQKKQSETLNHLGSLEKNTEAARQH